MWIAHEKPYSNSIKQMLSATWLTAKNTKKSISENKHLVSPKTAYIPANVDLYSKKVKTV